MATELIGSKDEEKHRRRSAKRRMIGTGADRDRSPIPQSSKNTTTVSLLSRKATQTHAHRWSIAALRRRGETAFAADQARRVMSSVKSGAEERI
jgi:hypothetical protein